MKDQKGITLIELLVAVVIAGLIIVPLLTIMTGTLTRTVSQEKEIQLAYIAQTVMEAVRENTKTELQSSGCWSNISSIDGCEPLTKIDINTTNEVYVETVVKTSPDNKNFNEVNLIVKSPINVLNGPNGEVQNKEASIELVTVVNKKP